MQDGFPGAVGLRPLGEVKELEMPIPHVGSGTLLMSAAVPVKLMRGNQAMILVYGSLPTQASLPLRRAGLLVGSVLTSTSFRTTNSLDACDYLFVGSDGDREDLFGRALRDCARSGWRLCNPPDPGSRIDRMWLLIYSGKVLLM
jgi:hypothetical protein